ncbi:MAG: hypothetical protein KBT33_04510 [Prevotellaceae bacterium]|nr:hypothetical protein [Candidatus Minthosoma equi]
MKELNLHDNEEFAKELTNILPEVFEEIGIDAEAVDVSIDYNEPDGEMLYSYATDDDDDELSELFREGEDDEELFTDDDEGPGLVSFDDFPAEWYYVKMFYKDLCIVVYLDEYGLNDDYWTGVHFLFLYSRNDRYKKQGQLENLCNNLTKKFDANLPEFYIDICGSEDEDYSYENIMNLMPYVDIFISDNNFASNQKECLKQMLSTIINETDIDLGFPC